MPFLLSLQVLHTMVVASSPSVGVALSATDPDWPGNSPAVSGSNAWPQIPVDAPAETKGGISAGCARNPFALVWRLIKERMGHTQQMEDTLLQDLPWLPAFDRRDALVVCELLGRSFPRLKLSESSS